MADVGIPRIAVRCFYLQLLPSLGIAVLASPMLIISGPAYFIDCFVLWEPCWLGLPFHLFPATFVMHIVTGIAIRRGKLWSRVYALWSRRAIIVLFVVWIGLLLKTTMDDPLAMIPIIFVGPIIGAYILLSWPALILLQHPTTQAYFYNHGTVPSRG